MNKKLSLSLAACTCLAVLFACSDNTLSTERNPVDTKAKLHVIVKDNYDGSQLPAKVTMQSTGESQTVPVPDAAIFTGVNAGSHSLLSEMEGYASKITNASIDGSSSGDVYIAGENHKVVELPKANSSLEGYLFYTDKEGKSVPMADAIVRIEFGDTELVERSVDVVVDANGKYSFSGLPAVGSNYVLRLIGAAIDLDYGTYTYPAQSPLEKDAASYNQKIDYNTNSGGNSHDFTIISQVSNITILNEDAEEPLVFKFSQEIDLNRTKSNSVTVDAVANILFVKDSLIITPVGKWEGGNFNVCFNTNEVVSVLGKHLSPSSVCYSVNVLEKNISTVKVEGFVNSDSASIDYNSASASFRWKRVEGATKGYEVFKKEYGEEDYKPIDCDIKEPITESTDVVAVCNLDEKIAYKTISFIVRAANKDYKSLFSDEVNVYERKPLSPDYDMAYNKKSESDPIVYLNSSELPGSWILPKKFDEDVKLGGYLADPSAQIIPKDGWIYFDRAMDTDAKFVVSCKEESEKDLCSKLELVPEWSGDQKLKLIVRTKKYNTITTTKDSVSAIYSISGLKAKVTGEKFATEYKDDKINTVNIRFTADHCSIDPFNEGCYCSNYANHLKPGECCISDPNNKYCYSYNECELYGKGEKCLEYCRGGDGQNYVNNPTCREYYHRCEFYGVGYYCSEYCKSNYYENNYDGKQICKDYYTPCEFFAYDSEDCTNYCESNPDDAACPKVVFFDDFEDGGKKWAVHQLYGNDQWFIGTAVTNSPVNVGDKKYTAYIGDSENYTFDLDEENISILYTTIEFPSVTEGFFTFNFYLKGQNMTAFLCPFNVAIKEDTFDIIQGGGGDTYSGCTRILGGTNYQEWDLRSFKISREKYAGGTYKLVFRWESSGDGNTYYSVPAVIDNVEIIYHKYDN